MLLFYHLVNLRNIRFLANITHELEGGAVP